MQQVLNLEHKQVEVILSILLILQVPGFTQVKIAFQYSARSAAESLEIQLTHQQVNLDPLKQLLNLESETGV